MNTRSSAADILVVDDNPQNLFAIETALGDLGRCVVRAHSGTEALRLLLERDFALVLLDVQMPSMDGFETAKLIRSRKRSRHTPIVFMTAFGHDDRQVLAAYALGAVDFLFKPIVAEVLCAKASVFVELQARTAEVALQGELIREHTRREHERSLQQERERWESESLRCQMEQMTEADRHKDRFIALLGHELRNPLAAICTGLELMRAAVEHGAESPAAQLLRTQRVVERQVQHLTRLVDDLVDLARIRSGKISLQKTNVRLFEVLEQAVGCARAPIERAGHTLTVELPDRACEVHGDPVRLSQVFANLLNNAARYTPPGGRIELHATRGGNEIEIRVRDNGKGISPEFLPHAFDPFRQETDHGEGGLGLGLSIVRQVVLLHDGSVWARSDGPGLGSEFTVRLPLCVPASVTAAPGSGELRRTAHGPLSIVVIDDSDDVRELMAELLRNWGHRVDVAADGEAGAALALRRRPDVAFVDIGLPKLDGYGVASRLRDQFGPDGMRLVAMSGFGQERDKQRSRAVGFDLHIVKPASIDALKLALTFEDDAHAGNANP